eukprot:CAMPEP_0198680014 /NCGR_PEP_ID=MMETSP1468-20131203/3853_1 /TAXON_ID=1461545 /ORGANISM="Mantoniella sp, Strain CCMP1436" /LENGTH=75 /DNA_ID=CAMNT_0044419541 /DNA_START=65 /DNA_END=289 /DNA_ORIENTATION=-
MRLYHEDDGGQFVLWPREHEGRERGGGHYRHVDSAGVDDSGGPEAEAGGSGGSDDGDTDSGTGEGARCEQADATD